MKTIELFFRCYLVLWLAFVFSACAVTDFLLGKDKETIVSELDVNKDGKLSVEEIKASKYDLDKDGELSVAEMEAAMAPNETTDGLLMVLSALNVPFAGAATCGLSAARKNKQHVVGLIAAGERIKNKVANGDALTRDGLKSIYKEAKSTYSKDVGHLTKIYEEVKEQVNSERSKRKGA